MSSGITEKALVGAGFLASCVPANGSVAPEKDAYKEALKISDYAVRDADRGDKDSGLMAECIRFVAVNARGANRVADVVVGVLIDGD